MINNVFEATMYFIHCEREMNCFPYTLGLNNYVCIEFLR